METKTLYKETGYSTHGGFSVEIIVGATKLPDLTNDSIMDAAYTAAELVKSSVMEEIIKNNPRSLRLAADQKNQLVALFPAGSYVEEIPNEYCSGWCCKHLPWFDITTPVGHFTIGWRKRVISIDWTNTLRTKTAFELFPNEDVTKDNFMIHAWSYEDAKRYIDKILTDLK